MDKFFLGRGEAVFVFIDLQERLAAVMGERRKVVDNCLHLLEIARLTRLPLILTEQYPKGLGPTVDEIKNELPSHDMVEKITFSCCETPEFILALSRTGRKKVILAGMETHVCVLQTCIGLLKRGYSVHAVGDATCSRKKSDYRAGIGFMRDAGAVITCTETVLFQLLGAAGTDEFKSISSRIK